ncbi:hypothetical protein DWB77_03532 [Streptomyces hundungensis]|uniref:Uncharacterized protein n=1 Tax=Streptomyces hundungensis TaxID=1077946 RepID=A0A387HC27_9ACTN|nr:hypothetical protein [Streptomyces hundungensis]AYG81386.1 hypothetical protein DWB77_03532 [Streptomyces hundungensis]
MGIESDQLVYDYLSRVGDLAQQRQVPSGDRMRLVSSLRNEIDKQRAKYATETPATVRRVLGRFGTPEEVVDALASGTAPGFGSGAPAPRPAPDPAVPVQRDRPFPGRGKRVPRPRPRRSAETPPPAASSLPSPPHLAGMDELGRQGDEPDWWRIGPGGSPGAPGLLGGDSIAGFVGGVEIPEILRPPVDEDEDELGEGKDAGGRRRGEADAEGGDEDGVGGVAEDEDLVEVVPSGRRLPRLRRRRRGSAEAGARPAVANPFLLLAAALLATGALFGLWVALGAGWLLAYASRRLTRAESKWAVLGMPGLTLLGGLVWLWGRQDGRWGEPIAQGEMGAAMTDMWPWLVRVAAVASAGFLVWRARRVGQ